MGRYFIQHESGWFAYQWYFVRKWHSSMRKKQSVHPQHKYKDAFKLGSVSALTDLFVQQSTPFENSEQYFHAYSVAGDRLSDLATPTHIIASLDDPVIPHPSFSHIKGSNQQFSNIQIHMQNQGGHCGFIEDFWCTSWLNKAFLELLSDQVHQPEPSARHS